MDQILSGLNNAQRDAVTSPSNVLQVLAPPGSGKTKTLTARVAYLLTHLGYAPWNIICCTFTIKASREMRERLRGLIGEELESRLILGTFHSICRRYLVRYGNKIDLPKGFGIADSSDSLAMIKRIIKRLNLSIEPSPARSRISSQKAKGTSQISDELNRVKSPEQQEYLTVFAEYEADLARSNLLDYDDLLLRCLDLLRQHPECVSNVETVLIDEFQDTNVVQFELMKLFASAKSRITIVGDPDQSIYGFRSAEIKNLFRMKECYNDTTVINLEENYRSCGAILLSAQDIIEQDTSRPAKRLKPTHRHGTKPTFRKLPSTFAEASWIVLEIQRAMAMTGNMLKYSDFAILLRSAALSRLIESAMGKAGIPYRMVGGHRFFDRKEIRILLDYLRTISQPQNDDAFMAIINVPSRKIGDKTVEMLVEEARSLNISLFTYVRDIVRGNRRPKKLLMNVAVGNLTSLVDLILASKKELKTSEPRSAPRTLLEFIISSLSYREYLRKTFPEDEEEDRWANVEELLFQAEDLAISSAITESEALPQIEGIQQETNDGGEEAVSQFLANISLSSEVQTDDDGEQHKVTISTIHAAKGLEWPVVFIPAVYEGSIPHSRAEDNDEERRLLYVAMTRAQALLYLSHPLRQSRGDGQTVCSAFIVPRSLTRFFGDAGPKFDELLVQSIARTLGRDNPSDYVIVEEMQKLRSISDDLWPLDGTPGEEERRRKEEQQGMAGSTLSNTSSSLTGTTTAGGLSSNSVVSTTMEQAHSFSIPGNGFTTASTLQQYMCSAKPKIELPTHRPETNGTKGSKKKQRDDTQGSIASFFSKSTSQRQNTSSLSTSSLQQPRDSKSSHHHRQTASSVTSVSSLLAVSRESRLQNQSMSSTPVIPSHLSTHRIASATSNLSLKRPRVLEDIPVNPVSQRRKHELLQSSSPPPECTDEKSDASLSTAKTPKEVISFDGYRAVQTMVPGGTTMSRLGQSGTGRRTLGVRRSMNGWADRMKR